jgi:hypothetical protein
MGGIVQSGVDVADGIERALERRARVHQFGLDQVDLDGRAGFLDEFECLVIILSTSWRIMSTGNGRKDPKGS